MALVYCRHHDYIYDHLTGCPICQTNLEANMTTENILRNRQVVLKAADLIEKHGLVSGIRQDQDGRMCVLGALEVAKYGSDPYGCKIDKDKMFLKTLADALELPTGTGEYSSLDTARLADWSNAQTNKMVVVTALRDVAYQLFPKV